MIRCVVLPLACLTMSLAAAGGEEPKPPAADQKAAEQKAGPLDIIPADAVAAIAIRDVSELIERGDNLIDEGGIEMPGFRLSDGYSWLIDHLGVRRGLDKQGSAALMILKPQINIEAVALYVPVADWSEMTANFKLTAADLAEGRVVDRGQQDDYKPRYLLRRGGHLLMGGAAAALETVAKGKSLASSLSGEDRASLAQDDILFYANPRRMDDVWAEALRISKEDLAKLPPGELPTLRRVAEAIDDLQYAVGGLRLEGGVGTTVLLEFQGAKSREVLTPLAGGQAATTTLAGLPAGRVLAGHATSGDGQASADLVRDLAQFWLLTAQVNSQPLVSSAHQSSLAGVLGQLWRRLEGSRTALYENEHPDRDGHVSLVAILDTADAERFVADMTGLAPFVNASLLPPDAAPAIDAKTIDGLVAQLGDEDFQVRELASTKLALIGTAALAALEKAAQSSDPETKFRAQSLREQTLGSKADLLEKNLLSQIRPNFAYFPKQETRSGRPVDFVQLRLQDDEAEYVPHLRRLLGPEWSKLRLATVGKRVIVLAGSNTALLDAAIENVKTGAKPLEDEAGLAGFRSRAPAGQTAELHLSQGRWLDLLRPEAEREPVPHKGNELTSLGLTIGPQRLRFQLFAPLEEIKSVAKQFRR